MLPESTWAQCVVGGGEAREGAPDAVVATMVKGTNMFSGGSEATVSGWWWAKAYWTAADSEMVGGVVAGVGSRGEGEERASASN